MAEFWTIVVAAVGFLSDLVTVVLGFAAIYAFFYKRKELSLALRGITQMLFNQRVHRLKETLGKLDRLNYDEKDHRREIMSLVGELGGQLRPLVHEFPKLSETFEELTAVIDRRKRISEVRKQRLVHELHGFLDDAMLGQQASVIERKP